MLIKYFAYDKLDMAKSLYDKLYTLRTFKKLSILLKQQHDLLINVMSNYYFLYISGYTY